MTGKIVFAGALVAFVLSLCSLAFFAWYVDPEYLNFSGFFLFYASLAAWAWSAFYLFGRMLFSTGRKGRHAQVLGRRTALLALLATTFVILSQLRWLSLPVIIGASAGFLAVEYYYVRR